MKTHSRCQFCNHYHLGGIGEKCRKCKQPNPHFDSENNEWSALEYLIGIVIIIVTFVLTWRYID